MVVLTVKSSDFKSTSRLLRGLGLLVRQIVDLGVPAREINSRAYLLVRRHGLDTPEFRRDRTTRAKLLAVAAVAGCSKEKKRKAAIGYLGYWAVPGV